MKLLIAHTSGSLQRALERQLSGEFDILSCEDGETALSMLAQYQPEVLVIQDGLYRLDGLAVLQAMPHRPQIILFLTATMDMRLLRQLEKLGADRILRMATAYTVVEALIGAMQQLPQILPPIPMQRILRELGFRPSADGYRQLCQAAELLCQDPRRSLSRDIYPVIAPQNPATAEHNIRNAIEGAWKNGDPAAWQRWFPGARHRPRVKAFLFTLIQDHWNRQTQDHGVLSNGTVHG